MSLINDFADNLHAQAVADAVARGVPEDLAKRGELNLVPMPSGNLGWMSDGKIIAEATAQEWRELRDARDRIDYDPKGEKWVELRSKFFDLHKV